MPCVQSEEHGYISERVNEPQNGCFDSNWKAITRDANRLVHNTPSPSIPSVDILYPSSQIHGITYSNLHTQVFTTSQWPVFIIEYLSSNH